MKDCRRFGFTVDLVDIGILYKKAQFLLNKKKEYEWL